MKKKKKKRFWLRGLCKTGNILLKACNGCQGMDCSGLIAQKFVKIVFRKEISKNKLCIPLEFCEKYRDLLPARFFLKFRNGYELPVKFDENTRLLKGFLCLYEDYGFKGGEMLVFQYYGRNDMNVYIICTNCSEIEYPNFVHHLQSFNSQLVNVRKDGMKFVKFVDPTETIDEIDPPPSFKDRCAEILPVNIRFVLSNDKIFVGHYNRQTRKITGFGTMCSILGLANLNSFHMLVFDYDGFYLITVSAFDENLLELVFPGSPMSAGENFPSPPVASRFEITIQPSHMYPYCYGVNIPAEYKNLWYVWRKTDYISIFSGTNSWKLQIKHRSD